LTQDLGSTVYRSERLGKIPCGRLAIPHARRALAQLRQEHGEDVDGTALGRALLARVAQDGTSTDVAGFGGCILIRGEGGRYSGAFWRDIYRNGSQGS
jgi:hypothetical protein